MKKKNRKEKIKLLVVSDLLFPYTGITKFLIEVLPKLKNFEITIVYPEKEKKFQIKGIKEVIIPYNFKLFGIPITKPNKRNALEKLVSQSDLVWIQFISPLSILAINHAKNHGKKIVAFLHIFEDKVFHANAFYPFNLFENVVKKISQDFYNKCDLIIVPAKNVGVEIRKRNIKSRQKVVPLGVNLKNNIKKETARKKLGIGEDKFVITYIGRLSKEKDVDTLLKAYKKFKEEVEDALLLLVSYGNKLEMEKIKEIKGVKITGYVSEVLPYLSASDVYVLPSVTETTSLTTLEAMYTGLPVIVTRVGYVGRYVKNMKNGLFFEVKDSEDLIKKIRMLYNNKSLREKLGKNARKTAKNLSWRKTASSLSKIFTSLMNDKRK